MRKYIALLFVAAFCCFIAVSCDFANQSAPNDNRQNSNTIGDEETVEDEEFIWREGSSIFVVGSSLEFENTEFADAYSLAVYEIYSKLSLDTAAHVELVNDKTEKKLHEIVIGYADREISRKAYELLDKIKTSGDKNDVLPRYLLYSDGRSIALAFDRNEENVAMDAAVDYFCNKLLGEFLSLPYGTVSYGYFSMNELHQERDSLIIAESWANYRFSVVEKMTPTLGAKEAEKYADDLVMGLESIYAMYGDELVEWFAELYEPYICICEGECQNTKYCGGAGFYYSNSARDNDTVTYKGNEYLLLPDAETTAQVLGFIKQSGMLNLQNGDYFSAFPEGEPERIIRFIKALQDENSGYFYHPQWLSLLGSSDFWDSRQSRDMSYSISTLSCFGASPTYDTPGGTKGDGILYDGTKLSSAAKLTMPLLISKSRAVSKVVMTSAVHPNLVSKESFASYLSKLNISGNSYYVGNELSSLASQIVARDKELGTESDPRPLATMLDEWLRKNQDPNTGHWHKTSSGSVYYPINGMLKIATLYNTLELPFPNPQVAATSAFSVITAENKIEHVCDLYNTWFAVSCIMRNLTQYSDNAALANEIISEVRVGAVEAVRATSEKMKAHQKEDGSFSYFETRSSSTSQNMPVAIPNTNEGDVNATVIFTYGILDYMFDALGFGGKRPMFTDCDREAFLNIITERIEACENRKNENKS